MNSSLLPGVGFVPTSRTTSWKNHDGSAQTGLLDPAVLLDGSLASIDARYGAGASARWYWTFLDDENAVNVAKNALLDLFARGELGAATVYDGQATAQEVMDACATGDARVAQWAHTVPADATPVPMDLPGEPCGVFWRDVPPFGRRPVQNTSSLCIGPAPATSPPAASPEEPSVLALAGPLAQLATLSTDLGTLRAALAVDLTTQESLVGKMAALVSQLQAVPPAPPAPAQPQAPATAPPPTVPPAAAGPAGPVASVLVPATDFTPVEGASEKDLPVVVPAGAKGIRISGQLRIDSFPEKATFLALVGLRQPPKKLILGLLVNLKKKRTIVDQGNGTTATGGLDFWQPGSYTLALVLRTDGTGAFTVTAAGGRGDGVSCTVNGLEAGQAYNLTLGLTGVADGAYFPPLGSVFTAIRVEAI